VEKIRKCEGEIDNMYMYGGDEKKEEMIKRKVKMWMLKMELNDDDKIKYYE
jgi:hypothetical protein